MLEKRIKEIEEKQERIGEWSERTIQLEKKEESRERERKGEITLLYQKVTCYAETVPRKRWRK